jgi:hypothetical protein
MRENYIRTVPGDHDQERCEHRNRERRQMERDEKRREKLKNSRLHHPVSHQPFEYPLHDFSVSSHFLKNDSRQYWSKTARVIRVVPGAIYTAKPQPSASVGSKAKFWKRRPPSENINLKTRHLEAFKIPENDREQKYHPDGLVNLFCSKDNCNCPRTTRGKIKNYCFERFSFRS